MIGSASQRLILNRCLARHLILGSLLIGLCIGGFAQDDDAVQSNFLLGESVRLIRLRDSAVQEILRLENEIRRADAAIANGEKIIQIARDRGDSEAEAKVQSLLATASEVRSKNNASKTSLELTQRQIEAALAAVLNKLASAGVQSIRIQSTVSAFTGRVSIQKKNEEPSNIDGIRPVFLENGAVVTTYDKSTVELKFLEGRGTLKMGENSQIEIADDKGANTQAIKLVKGAVNISVEKLETYEKELQKKIDEYEADLKTVKDEAKQLIVDDYNKKMEGLRKRVRKKFEVRTPAAVTSVRNTRFNVRLDGPERTEIIMFEGSVEVKPLKATKPFVVEAGYKAVFSADGIVTGPEKIDPSKYEMR
jgi:hypothetical protein